jgi:hypothetical protein
MRLVLVWLLLALSTACSRERPGLPPRHLLLVTIENLRADHLSAYGYAKPTGMLPSDPTARLEGRVFALDELAAQGVVFAQAFAPSDLALPSLASLFTARAPLALGVMDNHSRVARSVPVLGELAARSGMRTAAFVSSSTNHLDALGRGFETAHWVANDELACTRLREWLRQDFGDHKPTLIWLHLSDLAGCSDDPALYDEALRALNRRLSEALASAFDYQTRGTESTEFLARTCMVIAGLNGHALAGEGTAASFAHSEGALRVPLILRHSDSLTGERVLGTPVELVDVLPTLMDLFAWERPAVMEGHSLLGLTDARRLGEYAERALITQTRARVLTARTRAWRMVWNPYRARLPESDPLRQRPELELFAVLGNQVAEQDTAGLQPAVVADLKARMTAWVLAHLPPPTLPLEGTRLRETTP